MKEKLLIIKVCGHGELTDHIMDVAAHVIRMNTTNNKLYGEVFVEDLRVFYYYVEASPKDPCQALHEEDFDKQYEAIEHREEQQFDEQEAESAD